MTSRSKLLSAGRIAGLAAVAAVSVLTVTASPAAAQSAAAPPAPAAPAVVAGGSMGEFNTWANTINTGLATYAIAPALKVWRSLPEPVPLAGRNVYQNMTEPVNALTRAMASDTTGAVLSASRFAINSTVGLFGILDVANAVGLPPRKSYFGEGVCKANIPVGPYVVVPLAGDSTVGVAATAMVAMVGSTAALALVSFQMALASTAVDLIAMSTALENLAGTDGGDLATRQADYSQWMASNGCRPS